ncbi:MAG: hypothetical protein JSV21_00135, partial [Nitrospirota bacterium]
ETEGDYIDIGMKLREYYERSGNISEFASAVAELMSGEKISGAIADLKEVIKSINIFIEETDRRSGERIEALQTAFGMVDGVKAPLIDLKAIVKNMGYLSLSTKIHSSRMLDEGSDFIVLAEDIKKLSELIGEKSVAMKNDLGALSDSIEKALTKIKETRANHSDRLRKVIKATSAIVDSLDKTFRSAAERTEGVKRMSDGLSEKIDEIVEAMQYHDISRQKFEHVATALGNIIDLADAGMNSGEAAELDLALNVRDVSELQMSHLALARDEMLDSVRTISVNLKDVSSDCIDLLKEIRKIAGTDSGNDGSIVSQMDEGLNSASDALDILARNNIVVRELSTTMHTVIDAVDHITAFIRDMDEIESEIEVIALNASLKAAKIGEKGMALGVVARKMQAVSTDAHEPTAAISDFIKTIKLTAEILNEQIIADDNEQIENIMHMLEDRLRSLRSINDNIISDLGKATSEGEALKADTGQAVESINVQYMVDRVVTRIMSGLKEVVRKVSVIVGRGHDGVVGDLLDDLSERYTMQTEHSIHEKFIDTKAGIGKISKDERKKVGDIEGNGDGKEGFGNNVELF